MCKKLKALWYYIRGRCGHVRCSGYRVYPNGVSCYGCGDCKGEAFVIFKMHRMKDSIHLLYIWVLQLYGFLFTLKISKSEGHLTTLSRIRLWWAYRPWHWNWDE